MSQSIEIFKAQQAKSMQVLKTLKDFLEKGKALGVEVINDAMIQKIDRAIDEVNGKLKVVLVGGFSEGKTSIVAAWLNKLDKSSMNISQEESSNQIVRYNLNDDVEIIDTPGLFGFKEKNVGGNIEQYKEITRKYVSEAHILLYVMNPANPIKETHSEELKWLFGGDKLDLLSRTVFVISKFDEEADLEDKDSYNNALDIKKRNIADRLTEILNLSDSQKSNLSIVAVSANPYGEGVEYWLSNLEAFKKISHISTLDEQAKKKIEESGGKNNIIYEAQKTIIVDVLDKQLPTLKEMQKGFKKTIKSLLDAKEELERNLKVLDSEVKRAQNNICDSAEKYFDKLIRSAQGLSLETFISFIQSEIGNEGSNIDNKIKRMFFENCQSVNESIQGTSKELQISLGDYDKEMMTYAKNGINFLKNSGVINGTNIKVARDAIVDVAKWVGLDIAKYLKFKPWGAVNLAQGLNGALAAVGLGVEIWDSYQESQRQAEFEKARRGMIDDFNKQKAEIIDLTINQDKFVEGSFPQLLDLKQDLKNIIQLEEASRKEEQDFDKWLKEADIIEAEFEEIKKS